MVQHVKPTSVTSEQYRRDQLNKIKKYTQDIGDFDTLITVYKLMEYIQI